MKRNNDNLNDDRKPVLICITTIYLFIVLYITIFDRDIGERRAKLELLWEIKKFMEGSDYKYWLGQIGGNLVMLLPLGILLPTLSDFFRNFRKTVLAGFCLSLFIELTQYITGRGLCESDDILHNTIGVVAGFIIYLKVRSKLQNKNSIAD